MFSGMDMNEYAWHGWNRTFLSSQGWYTNKVFLMIGDRLIVFHPFVLFAYLNNVTVQKFVYI
jgi:hypothetical protein